MKLAELMLPRNLRHGNPEIGRISQGVIERHPSDGMSLGQPSRTNYAREEDEC